MRTFLLTFLLASAALLNAQQPDTLPPAAEEEDYSIYENATFAETGAKRYCSPKILDISPLRFVSLGWDVQLPYDATFSPLGEYPPDSDAPDGETGQVEYTGGLRFQANIPVVARNSVVWQLGANYWDVRYRISDIRADAGSAGLLQRLDERGLRTLGLNTTVFKPLGEKQFLLFQGSADLNGDYTWSDFQSLRYLRYSVAALWGRRPNDRKMWGVGISRTYRAGEMNYFPVVMFNWTAPNRRWGVEMLLPARGHVRRTFSPRSILLVGYELEGQSYHISNLSTEDRSFEIRRGELRARAEYLRQLSGFIWLSAQAGWRYNWTYNADYLDDNREFFRGFFGDQKYAMLNSLGNPLYFSLGICLVSP